MKWLHVPYDDLGFFFKSDCMPLLKCSENTTKMVVFGSPKNVFFREGMQHVDAILGFFFHDCLHAQNIDIWMQWFIGLAARGVASFMVSRANDRIFGHFLGSISAPFFDILKMQQKTPNVFRGAASILVRKLRVSKKVVRKCQKMQNYSDFRPEKCRFFGILQKKCKKVIFLLNALIFKKNIFDLLPQNKKTRFFKTILRFPKMDKNKCPKLKMPKKFWENGFFGIWEGILRKP